MAEDRINKRVAREVDKQILAVHEFLDAFEMWVIELQAPTMDLISIGTQLANMCTDVNSILHIKWIEPESAPTKLEQDAILEALSNVPAKPQSKQCMLTKMHHSIHTTEAGDEYRVRKRERIEMERTRKASLVDQDIRHRRVLGMVARISSYVPERRERSSTYGVEVDEGTTKVVQIDDPASSE